MVDCTVSTSNVLNRTGYLWHSWGCTKETFKWTWLIYLTQRNPLNSFSHEILPLYRTLLNSVHSLQDSDHHQPSISGLTLRSLSKIEVNTTAYPGKFSIYFVHIDSLSICGNMTLSNKIVPSKCYSQSITAYIIARRTILWRFSDTRAASRAEMDVDASKLRCR